MKSIMQTIDGMIRFSLQGETETKHEADALIVVTLADELVRHHSLATDGESYQFTAAFLRDLAIAFREKLELPAISSSVAVKLWHAAQQEVYGLKKNMSVPQSSPGPSTSILSS